MRQKPHHQVAVEDHDDERADTANAEEVRRIFTAHGGTLGAYSVHHSTDGFRLRAERPWYQQERAR